MPGRLLLWNANCIVLLQSICHEQRVAAAVRPESAVVRILMMPLFIFQIEENNLTVVISWQWKALKGKIDEQHKS